MNFSNARPVSYNALVKLSGEVVGRAASFALVLIAARALGETGFGLYNYGLALGFIVAQIADFGLQLLVAREIAAQGEEAQPAVVGALRLKLILSLPVLLLLVVTTGGYSGPDRLALIVLGLSMLAQTYLEFTGYVFRGQQNLMAEARLLMFSRLLMAALGAVVLLLGGGLLALALTNLAAIALLAARGTYLLWREGWLAGFWRGGRPAGNHLRAFRPYLRMLQQALPLGVAIFLAIAYSRLAVLLLQYRLGPDAVASFSAAQRLVEPGQILPASLMAAVFPAYTRALYDDTGGARRLAGRSTLFLAALGVTIAAGFWWAAPWLIPVLYGDAFAESVPVLQVLGFSTIPAFINYSLTHYLIARGRQAYIGFFTGAMLVLHAGLTWFLMDGFGAVAPAISVVVAEGVLFVCCVITLALTRPRLAALATNRSYVTTPEPTGSNSSSTPSTL